MTIQKDSAAATEALGQPTNALLAKLVIQVEAAATDIPKTTSRRQQVALAKALAYAEELLRRQNGRQFNPAC